ncbi:MAG: hypothetical protein M3145_10175 [Pseudomonadota bacterium]|nr:hypothetical protein [Pseudomonadota bacterium]
MRQDRSGIDPSDLSRLLARFGLVLIVDEVERESAMPELLDDGVRCRQGRLFGALRLVRAEASMASLPQAAE